MADLWVRQVEVLAGGKRFVSDELDIDFDVPFDCGEEPDIAEITIYNLSESSINAVKNKQNIIVNAGYKGDIGTIFMGTLQKTVTQWEGTDKATTFTIGDGANQWLSARVSKSYAENVTASAIIRDLLSMFGLEAGRLSLKKDTTYKKGRIVDAMLKDALKQIVSECGSGFNISRGKLNITPVDEGIQTGILLNAATGLTGSPEAFEAEEDGRAFKGYKIQSLLNHRIIPGCLIRVESKTANGTYRVKRGRHTSDFTTEIEVLEQ